jgi:hypothetical protein
VKKLKNNSKSPESKNNPNMTDKRKQILLETAHKAVTRAISGLNNEAIANQSPRNSPRNSKMEYQSSKSQKQEKFPQVSPR